MKASTGASTRLTGQCVNAIVVFSSDCVELIVIL